MSEPLDPRVEELFHQALPLTEEQRATLLSEACKDDPPEVRDSVEELLTLSDAGVSLEEALTLATRSTLPASYAAETQHRTIGNYRLVEKIQAGGMGEVWQADQVAPIRRRVALKLIKGGMESDSLRARFATEMQALAVMNHSNVAKVFDAGTTESGVPYYVMEYVPGVPITKHCDEHRLSTNERLRLFIQLCRGLQHAHDKGIVHRDIKPSNVLVSTAGDEPEVKVIDFGVAKAMEQPLSERVALTQIGQLVGTPEYMSPEQAEMSEQGIDERTDVYSMGVLLYELLVGVRALDLAGRRLENMDAVKRVIREEEPSRPSTRITTLGADAEVVAEKRRTQPSSLARELREDLDWIVLKAMDKDRTRRYPTPQEMADDVQRHLDRRPVLARAPGMAYRAKKFLRRPSRQRTILLAIVAAVLLTVTFEGARRLTTRGPTGVDGAVITIRPSVAVLDFAAPDAAEAAPWLQGAIAELLSAQLAMTPEVRVVDRGLVARRFAEGSLAALDAPALAGLGAALAADTVVTGQFWLEGLGGQLVRIRARAVDSRSGELLAEIESTTGPLSELPSVVNQVGHRLRADLGLEELPRPDERTFLASYPQGEAATSFFAGLAELQRGRPFEAEARFLEGLKVEEHARLYWRLARALGDIGYDDDALPAADQAIALVEQLPEEAQLLVRGYRGMVGREWQSAADHYAVLVGRHPDNPEYALNLALAQLRDARPEDAYDTVERLAEVETPAADDPRLEISQADAAYESGRYERALTLAQDAAAHATAFSDDLALAWARLAASNALNALGDLVAADQSSVLALEAFQRHGDDIGAQIVLENRVTALIERGNLLNAERYLRVAVANYRALGDDYSVGRALLNQGAVLIDLGRLEAAHGALEEAAQLLEQEDAAHELAGVVYHQGVCRHLEGELTLAEGLYHEAMATFVSLEAVFEWAATLSNLGEIALTRGDPATARNRHAEALSIFQRIDPTEEAYDRFRLGQVAAVTGDYAEARRLCALEEDAAAPGLDAARTMVSAAELDLYEVDLTTAESTARSATTIFTEAGAADWSAIAQSVLATVLLAAGDRDEAATLNQAVQARAAESRDFRVRFRSAVLDARLTAASGQPDAFATALGKLETVLRLAGAGGFKLFEYEIRLAAAAIERNAGREAEAQQAFATLIADANRDGLGQFARRAEALASRSS